MLNILVCEDDLHVLHEIENHLKEEKEYILTPCLIADEIDEQILSQKYDVVLMDIRLQEMNGICIAASMRLHQPNLKFIFISNYVDEYLEGLFLQIDPYGILKKPVNYSNLIELLKRLEQEKRNEKGLLLKVYGGRHVRFSLDDIQYFESNKRIVEIHYRDRVEKCYGTLDLIQKQLPAYFLRCHKSFLVNMNKIETFGSKEIILYNGSRIFVSQPKRKESLRTYIEFLGENL